MNSDRWKQLDSLLQSVLDHPPEERERALRRACAGDEALEREIRSLLTLEQEAGSFLESPAMEVAAQAAAARLEGSEPGPSLIGRTISHYRVLERLGSGGMGVVWKARDTRLNRLVALKVLPPERVSDPDRRRRFVQEAKAASALNHPNIVTVYDIGRVEAEGHPTEFIAMEFVAGQALDRLMSGKPLPVKDALHHAIQLADALAAAHTAGIAHRDLKPENILVNENVCVKVLDFGLAKLIEPAAGERAGNSTQFLATRDGVIVGTAAYMSPEQAEGKTVDARTDIFSFGAVLYEMVTGRRAFVGGSMVSILTAILRDDPRPASEIVHGIPRDLDGIITRCLQKDPARRYQHAGDLKIDLQQVLQDATSGASLSDETMRSRRGIPAWWRAAGLAGMTVTFAMGWWLHNPPPAAPSWSLRRLTSDPGLSAFPALSPDSKLVAYASDRASDGKLDLYIKQVVGGQPIRLTFDGAGNTTPDFSPDGSKIVFRSNREGGGVYEIPAFGGEARLIARDGLNPKYSPDGSQVAYWVGDPGVSAAVAGAGTVWVTPVSGGQAQRVGTKFTAARYPEWSPDGKHLILVGYTSANAYENSAIDWWVVSIEQDDAVRTGVYEALVRAKLRAPVPANRPVLVPPDMPKPGCWVPDANSVIFSLHTGDTVNLWQMEMVGTGKASGPITRLTTDIGSDVDPSCASGGITFAGVQTRSDVWSLPIDLNRGTATGAPERITAGPASREHASLARTAHSVAFASDQSGRSNIWVRDLVTGKESILVNSAFEQRYPVSSPSGGRVAYSAFEKNTRVLYVSSLGGAPEKLCEGCLRVTDWSHDEKTVLIFAGNPYEIRTLDVASHRQTAILKHASSNLLYARYSPDERWVSFTVRTQPSRARITIARMDGTKPVPESDWIDIAEVGSEDWANWSPDGRTLYFTSRRDGHSCFWGQRLDSTSHRPAGEPFAILHLHGRLSYQRRGWSAGGGRIAMVLVEDTGNIWMISRAGWK